MSIFIEGIKNARFNNTYGEYYEDICCFGLFSCKVNHGLVVINSNKCFSECYNIIDESKREEEGRLYIEEQVEYLRKYSPGFENAYLVGSAKNPYIERFGTIRGQAGCLVVGRGAGITAVAVKDNFDVSKVDVKNVQVEIRRQNTKLQI